MNKTIYILLFILFFTFNLIHSQEEKEFKFNFIAYGGIGYGIVENDNEPNYNLNSNSVEFLINYKISQKFGIGTGYGMNKLSGNGFNTNGNFYHERTILKIPLVATMNYNISDQFMVVANLGFFTQNITNDEYQFLNNTQKDIFDGWNFGAQLGIGFVFKIFDNFSAGINYSEQSDFSKFKSNNNQGINDKQKLKSRNSMGVIFIFEL